MQPTCEKEKCKIWQLLDGTCPNYIESWWSPDPLTPGPPILVADCAPRRTMLLIQEISNRLVGVEKSQEQARNETIWVQAIAELIGKNTGIDIAGFVEERNRFENIKRLTMLRTTNDKL